MKIGRVTASDRASSGVYEDRSGPAIEAALATLFPGAEWHRRIVPDERGLLAEALRELCDSERCDLVVTTGGTGPMRRDVTPEATRDVIERELPGFGEILRTRTFDVAPTSILSRATAGTRGSTLIVNLPGRPEAVAECLAVLGPAIVKCIDLFAAEAARGPDKCGETAAD